MIASAASVADVLPRLAASSGAAPASAATGNCQPITPVEAGSSSAAGTPSAAPTLASTLRADASPSAAHTLATLLLITTPRTGRPRWPRTIVTGAPVTRLRVSTAAQARLAAGATMAVSLIGSGCAAAPSSAGVNSVPVTANRNPRGTNSRSRSAAR